MSDYEAVYAFWQRAGPGIAVRPSDRREEVEKKLTRDADLFLVAEQDARVVGVIMGVWDGRRGWLHHLAVDAAYGGRGIAIQLIEEVEGRLRAKGCLKVNLLVHRDNGRARRLYSRMGYQQMDALLPMGKKL